VCEEGPKRKKRKIYNPPPQSPNMFKITWHRWMNELINLIETFVREDDLRTKKLLEVFKSLPTGKAFEELEKLRIWQNICQINANPMILTYYIEALGDTPNICKQLINRLVNNVKEFGPPRIIVFEEEQKKEVCCMDIQEPPGVYKKKRNGNLTLEEIVQLQANIVMSQNLNILEFV